MNAPTIELVAPNRRHYAACKNVPEFKMAPSIARRIWPGHGNSHDMQPRGPMPPPMVSNPRKVHAPRKMDDREVEWLNLRPLSAKRAPIKQTGFVAPLGALEGIDHMVARVEAIKRLTDQQERDRATKRAIFEADKEIPFIVDEFRANGFRAMSLSSSTKTTNDDELEAANIAEKHLGITPLAFGQKGTETVPTPEHVRFLCNMFGIEAPETITVPVYNSLEELPGILRRIDWERGEKMNGPLIRVRLVPNADKFGVQAEQPWMMKHLSPEMMVDFGKRMKAACRYKTFEELDHARAMCEYYGIGSGIYKVWHGEQVPEQTMNALGAEDLTVPKKERALPVERRSAALVAQGEQELGLHGTSEDMLEADIPWKDHIHEKGQPETDGDIILLGYGITVIEGRALDDPMSSNSRVWRSARNGRRWRAPWPELMVAN